METAPNLILLDMGLPGRDGLTFCAELRRDSNVPIIFVTCRDSVGDELQAFMISVPFIRDLAGSPEPGVMVGSSSPEAIVIISLTLFFLIYAVYFLIAYTGLKRNVLSEVL